jgi:predicted adenylyl cyclase CyaB
MIEIEIKVLEINKEEMIDKLIHLGAKKVLDEDVEAYYYDGNNLKKGQVLRLRKIGNKNFLTFKKKIHDKEISKREEHEIEISDLNKMHEILKNLNFNVIEKVNKHRTSYKIQETLFEIDEFKNENIPCLMEIESISKKKIMEFVKLLNIDENKLSTKGFFGLKKLYSELK